MNMERQLNQLNKNNERIGYWILQDTDKNKLAEGSYVNGKRDGKWILYRFDKTEETTIYYHEHETHIFYGRDEYPE